MDDPSSNTEELYRHEWFNAYRGTDCWGRASRIDPCHWSCQSRGCYPHYW